MATQQAGSISLLTALFDDACRKPPTLCAQAFDLYQAIRSLANSPRKFARISWTLIPETIISHGEYPCQRARNSPKAQNAKQLSLSIESGKSCCRATASRPKIPGKPRFDRAFDSEADTHGNSWYTARFPICQRRPGVCDGSAGSMTHQEKAALRIAGSIRLTGIGRSDRLRGISKTINLAKCVATQTLPDRWPTVCAGNPGAVCPVQSATAGSVWKRYAIAERPTKTPLRGST
jgi:hypothetical protein